MLTPRVNQVRVRPSASAETSPGSQYLLAHSARLGPLCESQRAQNSRNQPDSGPSRVVPNSAPDLDGLPEARVQFAWNTWCPAINVVRTWKARFRTTRSAAAPS